LTESKLSLGAEESSTRSCTERKVASDTPSAGAGADNAAAMRAPNNIAMCAFPGAAAAVTPWRHSLENLLGEIGMTGTVQSRLTAFGIALPTPGAPQANYIPTTTSGGLVFVSGQVSIAAGGERQTRHGAHQLNTRDT